MLTNAEKSGLKDVLHFLDNDDLYSILHTTSKQMIKDQKSLCRDDIIDKILLCTSTPSDLLSRKKITKKILFNYLMQVKASSLDPNKDKGSFIKLCLQLWQSSDTYQESDYADVNMEETTALVENSSFPSYEGNLLISMGLQFSQWFFTLLNSLNDFGPQHFWPDCYFKACIRCPSETREIVLNSANEVAGFLSGLIAANHLQLDANISPDSVICEQEEHGLVKVLVKGVLHRYADCVGLFDVTFGLVRAPVINCSWKIKCQCMNIQANFSCQTGYGFAPSPTLCIEPVK